MNQRGVHFQGTVGGEDRVFIIKVSDRPTVARNRTQTQWRPHRPNGKWFVNIGPESHSQSTKKASSVRSGTCLAQWAQYLWGRNVP